MPVGHAVLFTTLLRLGIEQEHSGITGSTQLGSRPMHLHLTILQTARYTARYTYTLYVVLQEDITNCHSLQHQLHYEL